MESLGVYATEESPNTGTRQVPRESEIEETTVNTSELIQTIKGLKTELESVKKDNERILKTQEELNQVLIERFQTEERNKKSESEEASQQKAVKRMKLAKSDSSSSSEDLKEQQSYYSTSDSSEQRCTRKRKSIGLMKKSLGNLRK